MSSAFVPTLVSGTQAVAAAASLRKQRRAESSWPFGWTEPPLVSEHVFRSGFLAAPAQDGNPHEILSYQVDDGGFFFCLSHVVLFYQVNGVAGGYAPGDFTFQLTINSPVGVAQPNAIPFKDFQNVQTCLGSPQQGPWPVKSGELSILHSRDTLRAVVTNTNIIAGAPNFFIASFVGWTWPSDAKYQG